MIIFVCILLVLFAIAWQDFRSRLVYWWLFPLLGGLFWYWKLSENGFWDIEAFLNNIVFLLIQFSLLMLYLRLRKGKWVLIWHGFIGWGDICFIAATALLLPFASFLVFYLLTLLFSLLLAFSRINVDGSIRSIPLAGEQAVWMILLLIVHFSTGEQLLFKDFGPFLLQLWV